MDIKLLAYNGLMHVLHDDLHDCMGEGEKCRISKHVMRLWKRNFMLTLKSHFFTEC